MGNKHDIKALQIGHWFKGEVVQFAKGEIGLEVGDVSRHCWDVKGVTKGNCTFTEEVIVRPGNPVRLSGFKGGQKHYSCSPSALWGGWNRWILRPGSDEEAVPGNLCDNASAVILSVPGTWKTWREIFVSVSRCITKSRMSLLLKYYQSCINPISTSTPFHYYPLSLQHMDYLVYYQFQSVKVVSHFTLCFSLLFWRMKWVIYLWTLLILQLTNLLF